MSEHKRANVASTAGVGLSINSGSKSKLRIRVLSLMLVVLLVLFGAGWLTDKYIRRTSPTTKSSSKVTFNSALLGTNGGIHAQATGMATSGNTAGAQQLLSQALSQTTDKAQQAVLYEEKAGVAYNAGDYSQCLQYAQQAESLNPTANSANWIAQSAEALGNKQLALTYYRLELQRLKPPYGPGDQATLQAKIQELEG
ncbi:MAG TPA: hypothetical protein VMB52_06215 [Verrucomicrobiae bacterium]|nr:hypothetical protein [Verrucomicrobiae bacterium]